MTIYRCPLGHYTRSLAIWALGEKACKTCGRYGRRVA